MFSHGPLLRCVCALKRAKAGYSLEDLATVISSLELWVSPDKKQGEEETRSDKYAPMFGTGGGLRRLSRSPQARLF